MMGARRPGWPIGHGPRRRTGGRWPAAFARHFGPASRASPLGAEEVAGALAGAAAAREVAGGEHDGGPIAARRNQPAASAHPLRGAIDPAVGGGACPERCLDRGFQGLVPDGGSDAVRSADGGGRLQSLRVLLSDRGPHPNAACGRGLSARFGSMACRSPCGPTTGRRLRPPAYPVSFVTYVSGCADPGPRTPDPGPRTPAP